MRMLGKIRTRRSVVVGIAGAAALSAVAVLGNQSQALAARPGIAAVAVPAPPVVVYTAGMGRNWGTPAVRPSEIVFGALRGFAGTGNVNKPGQLRPVHWTHWTGRSAYGSGQYFAGVCGCHSPLNVDYPADIALTDVQHHGSTRYFRDATITARGHRPVHLWYSGAWHQS